MKSLISGINLFVVIVVMVISVPFFGYGSQISTEPEKNNQPQDSPIEAIIKKVQEYSDAGKFEEALQELNIALEKFPQKEYQEKLQIELADLHYNWGVNLKNEYDYANAIKHFEMAYVIDKKYRPTKAATDLNNIGFSYSFLEQKQKALEVYQKALSNFQAIGDRTGEAMTLNNIGRVYDNLYQKHKALDFYQKALPIIQAVGKLAWEAKILNSIGRIYSDLDQKQKALEFYQKALSISQVVGDRFAEASALNSIGGVYDDLYQKNKALEFYQKALPISQAIGDRIAQAATLNNIGSVYSSLAQHQKAMEFYQKALPVVQAANHPRGRQ